MDYYKAGLLTGHFTRLYFSEWNNCKLCNKNIFANSNYTETDFYGEVINHYKEIHPEEFAVVVLQYG
jgi:hypothetical protein